MSVGSVRRRGQEGSPVLFPQQGLAASQWCVGLKYVWTVLDLAQRVKKKELQQQTAQAVLYSMFVYM